MLKERTDTGRALSRDDEAKLLEAIARSPSAALYPFFVMSFDTGLRPAETRALRRRDLNLTWRDGSDRARGNHRRPVQDGSRKRALHPAHATRLRCAHALAVARRRSRDRMPSYSRSIASGWPGTVANRISGESTLTGRWAPTAPRRAFNTARKTAGVDCRLYDARHTFITRLAENPAISEETIRQLAGHVSPRMLARYAHIRTQARRDAIATLECPVTAERAIFKGHSPQNPPQLENGGKPVLN